MQDANGKKNTGGIAQPPIIASDFGIFRFFDWQLVLARSFVQYLLVPYTLVAHREIALIVLSTSKNSREPFTCVSFNSDIFTFDPYQDRNQFYAL